MIRQTVTREEADRNVAILEPIWNDETIDDFERARQMAAAVPDALTYGEWLTEIANVRAAEHEKTLAST
jgi:hypothetical protein